jgi:uncharacterized protein YcaQ
MVTAQGLHERPHAAVGKEDALDSIRRMGVLQIDTISVIARSPYLALWSRIGNYNPQWLDDLLAEGRIFEYPGHAAAFIPIEDYPFYRHRMKDYEHGRGGQWMSEHPEVVGRVLSLIRQQGSARSADFERKDGKGGTWWDWKPEKIALEVLYNAGLLMIARRENFHRIYDLRERVLPGWEDTPFPSEKEVRRELALKAVRALGITLARWVPDYFRTSRRGIGELLEQLTHEGLLLRAVIDGINASAFIHRDHQHLAERIVTGDVRPTLTTLLSPFDPLVWDRKRALELFSFDYRIEIYVPEAKRQFGYFSTPILHRGDLVGRLDPKAHRKKGIFEVRSLHLDPGVFLTDDLVKGLAGMLRECAAWHETPEVILQRSDPPELAPLLTSFLSA